MPMTNDRRTGTAIPQSRIRRRHILIRILAVVTVLLILVALTVFKFMSGRDETMRIVAKHEIRTITQALDIYRRDNGRYPTQAQGLRALIEKPITDPLPNNWRDGGYLKGVPSDPWGSPYQYLNPGVHGKIDVFSYGPDAKQGGEGNDADIGSWE